MAIGRSQTRNRIREKGDIRRHYSIPESRQGPIRCTTDPSPNPSGRQRKHCDQAMDRGAKSSNNHHNIHADTDQTLGVAVEVVDHAEWHRHGLHDRGVV